MISHFFKTNISWILFRVPFTSNKNFLIFKYFFRISDNILLFILFDIIFLFFNTFLLIVKNILSIILIIIYVILLNNFFFAHLVNDGITLFSLKSFSIDRKFILLTMSQFYKFYFLNFFQIFFR
jgi:hypothetical protein